MPAPVPTDPRAAESDPAPGRARRAPLLLRLTGFPDRFPDDLAPAEGRLSIRTLRVDDEPPVPSDEAIAAIRDAGADGLALRVNGRRVAAWAERLAPLGLPLVVDAPIGARDEDGAAVAALAAKPGNRVLVRHRRASLPGGTRFADLASRLAGGTWSSVRGVLRTPVAHELLPCREDERWHDVLLAEISDALTLLAGLGIAPNRVRLASTPSLCYWESCRLAFDLPAGGEGSIELLPRGPAGPTTESLEAVSTEGTLRWSATESVEAVELDPASPAGSSLRRSRATFPLAGTAAAFAAAALDGSSLWDLRNRPEQAEVLSAAVALADEYLHGNGAAVRELRSKARAEELGAPGSPWHGMAWTTRSAYDLAFVPGLDRCIASLRPRLARFRVLLVRTPVVLRSEWDCLFPPLALAQLAAALNEAGVETKVLDLAPLVPDGGNEEARAARAVEILRERLGGEAFDLVGVSLEEASAWPVARRVIAADLRGRAGHLVIGGRCVESVERDELGGAVDSVVFGEGELPLLHLVRELAGERRFERVPGLWRAGTGSWTVTPIVLPHMDFHPTPCFDGLDLSLYRFRSELHARPAPLGHPFLPYLFVHGCPHRCAFCGTDSGQAGRVRHPDRVVDDLARMRDRHGVRDFYFLNNLVNIRPRYLDDLLAAMLGADLGIRWVDCARPSWHEDDGVFDRLVRAGCACLTFGVDTGSQRLADVMRKGYRIDAAARAIRRVAAAGIGVHVNLIMGMPTETEEDVEATLRFVDDMKPFVSDWSIPGYDYTSGSPLRETPRAFGLRRRGPTFDLPGGPTWDRHLEVRRRRVEQVRRALGS